MRASETIALIASVKLLKRKYTEYFILSYLFVTLVKTKLLNHPYPMANINYFGYAKPLNIIVKETVPPDSEMLPIWAAYFNMARYNMYTTLVHIAAATGLSDGENMENRMGHMRVLDEAVDPEVELRLRKLLSFPFHKLDVFRPQQRERHQRRVRGSYGISSRFEILPEDPFLHAQLLQESLLPFKGDRDEIGGYNRKVKEIRETYGPVPEEDLHRLREEGEDEIQRQGQ